MNTPTIHTPRNHAKSVINDLRLKAELPFEEFLPSGQLEQHCAEHPHRKRTFTPILTLCGFLSQAIGADKSCQAAVSQIIAHSITRGEKAPSANTAAYCKARSRLPECMLSGLVKETGKKLEAKAKPEWLWHGRYVKLVDGSTISMPDTAENQKVYPQPSTQKKGSDFQ